MSLKTPHYDDLAARRAEEIDEVIESLASFAGPPPTKVDTMFISLLLAYARLRARDLYPCTVLLGRDAYAKAKSSGLLAWCAEQYPQLTFEPPQQVIRGCHPRVMLIDEVAGING